VRQRDGAFDLRESVGGGGAHLRRPVLYGVYESSQRAVVLQVREVFYGGAANGFVFIPASL
jgi:hypothetical protein